MMEKGYLAIVLHAHLPYVRHPEYEESLEESWLYEAMTETYIPLLLVFDELIAAGIDFRLTMSFSPTLVSMLLDPLLQDRYLKRLERLLELSEKEIKRTRSQPKFEAVARMYHRLFRQVHDAYLNRYRRNLVQAFRRLQDLGNLEIIATAATHGYLPLLMVNQTAVKTQISVAREYHRSCFGQSPKGFWLPECAFTPGLDKLLREQHLGYTIVETHGLTRADPRPKHGVYAPVISPEGVAFFARDSESSKQVWSSIDGYPGDYDYREFYRDIGHDLDFDYIKPYIHRDGIRLDTGIKFYRITGKDNHKEVYVPEWAEEKAGLHADDFIANRQKQIDSLALVMDRKPIIVAPYDAELFGHWWFEGPRWLKALIQKVDKEQETFKLITLTDYLSEYPANQVAEPSISSWGNKGFHEVWLNDRNDWIYPHLHRAAGMLEGLAKGKARENGLKQRAFNQAIRELLLAQASDWAFMINAGTMVDYASKRAKEHLAQLFRICKEIDQKKIDEAWLSSLESRNNIFPDIDYRKLI